MGLHCCVRGLFFAVGCRARALGVQASVVVANGL